MQPTFAIIIPLAGVPDNTLPGFGFGGGHPDHTLPSHGHPGNALPIPPVKPTTPIVLPPGMWPPTLPPNALPPGVDNTLPPEAANKPIYIPPDPDVGIEAPIVIPPLPYGVALLIALPHAQPKAGTPPGTAPALLVQSGKKPVVVYVTAAAAPK
jgi:hypothetical protein